MPPGWGRTEAERGARRLDAELGPRAFGPGHDRHLRRGEPPSRTSITCGHHHGHTPFSQVNPNVKTSA
jgi:hypothetical protein